MQNRSSNIGGQAVMEGIMMRHKDKYSIGVRRPDGGIELKVEDYKCIFGKSAFLRKPVIRGVVSFCRRSGDRNKMSYVFCGNSRGQRSAEGSG